MFYVVLYSWYNCLNIPLLQCFSFQKNKEMIEETASDNPVQLETGEMPVYPAQTIFTDDEPEDETLLFKIIKFTFVGCCISIVVCT